MGLSSFSILLLRHSMHDAEICTNRSDALGRKRDLKVTPLVLLKVASRQLNRAFAQGALHLPLTMPTSNRLYLSSPMSCRYKAIVRTLPTGGEYHSSR